ncbi:MAG: zinc-dependent alcohol dehydrogenase family protein [Thermoanaerobaculum sp.]|nr:zinc-dependent alcohol dehydrogenase family protein [Thermoanaerobaculum sp.]MCX7896069.1 zinc-dependent alcohol dehydrogenase family protein [Thermoanaerobaculum sp.]MDW7967989.1 zinc-dependent alcohol dehydrogenase family protein [Thermoanaerobaculum sp.]
MRAMVLHAPAPAEGRPLRAEEVVEPLPGPGEVTLRVRACGVCRTDLHIVEGDLPQARFPLIPGHQVVGQVVGLGPGVDPSMLHATVGLGWMGGTCGECRFCREGRENLCSEAEFTGFTRPGGYAERAVAKASFCYRLPSHLNAERAAPLLCAGIIGYRALRLAGALEPVRVGFFGFGASAHVAIQVARFFSAQVFVFTRADQHQRHARELGASWAGNPTDPPPAPLDCAVIFSPAGEQVPLALQHVIPGGTVACAGITMSQIPSLPYALLYPERRLISVANATRQDARELLDLAARIPIHTQVEVLPLAEANEALLRVKRSQVQGALVLQP